MADNFILKYISLNSMIDITELCMKHMLHNNLVVIPSHDIMVKHLLTKQDKNSDSSLNDTHVIHIYAKGNLVYSQQHTTCICIDLHANMIYVTLFPEHISNIIYTSSFFEHKLWYIQSKLNIAGGFLYEEYPEQMLATKYLTGKENVLELGGNIGRNSMVISHILNKCNNNNFVTLETNKNYCDIIAYNRNKNILSFHIENSALSKRKLIQQGWTSVPSDVVLDEWTSVNTITYHELCNKYNIQFDTLVIDCEGAFFQILLDMGNDILPNIKTIIMENDYTELWKKQCVDYILQLHGFKVIDTLPLGVSIDWVVCPDNFYEVWKKEEK